MIMNRTAYFCDSGVGSYEMSAGFFGSKIVAEATRLANGDHSALSTLHLLDVMNKLHHEHNCLSIDATLSEEETDIVMQHVQNIQRLPLYSGDPSLNYLCTTLAGYNHIAQRVSRDYGIWDNIRVGMLVTQPLEESFCVLRSLAPTSPPTIECVEFFMYKYKFMKYGDDETPEKFQREFSEFTQRLHGGQ